MGKTKMACWRGRIMDHKILDWNYPLLKKVFAEFRTNADLGEYFLVCCQHIMEPQAKMFEYFISMGFDPKKNNCAGQNLFHK